MQGMTWPLILVLAYLSIGCLWAFGLVSEPIILDRLRRDMAGESLAVRLLLVVCLSLLWPLTFVPLETVQGMQESIQAAIQRRIDARARSTRRINPYETLKAAPERTIALVIHEMDAGNVWIAYELSDATLVAPDTGKPCPPPPASSRVTRVPLSPGERATFDLVQQAVQAR